MTYYRLNKFQEYLSHHGILGMKWGVRRYQNPDGSLTPEGQRRYNVKNDLIKYAEKNRDWYHKRSEFYKTHPHLKAATDDYGDGSDPKNLARYVKDNYFGEERSRRLKAISDENKRGSIIKEYRSDLASLERGDDLFESQVSEAKRQMDRVISEYKSLPIEDISDEGLEIMELYVDSLREEIEKRGDPWSFRG